MSEIILDFSANTHKNDKAIIDRAIDEIKEVDSGKHKIVFKSQLFIKEGENIVCSHDSFDYMYRRCEKVGYKCTASVFDKPSLEFLLRYEIPFVKIANRPDLYWLSGEVPRKIAVYSSVTDKNYDKWREKEVCGCLTVYAPGINLCCVSEYPARVDQYPQNMTLISDHTVGLYLWFRNNPGIWEKHLKLSDSTGLDAGSFAITPQELAEIL